MERAPTLGGPSAKEWMRLKEDDAVTAEEQAFLLGYEADAELSFEGEV
jgi:hypothetical protein